MLKKIKNKNGFTLIETIVVLLLVAILAAGAGMGIIAVTQGYLFASKNAQMAQKANIAMKRITLEFQEIITVSDMGSDTITFISKYGTRNIGFDSNTIKISENAIPIAGGDIVIDEVNSLVFSFKNSSGDPWLITDNIQELTGITIFFDLLRTDVNTGNIPFSSTVFLRHNHNTGGEI